MKKKKQIESELSFNLLIILILRNKFLFLILTTFFGLSALYYSSTITKIYLVSIKINKPYTSSMKNFSNIVDDKVTYSETKLSSSEFFTNFKNELIDPSNFANFLRSSKSSIKFIEKIEKKGVTLNGYLSNIFYEKTFLRQDKETQQHVIIEFKYPEEIDGYALLNDYANLFSRVFVEKFIEQNKKILINKLREVNFEKKQFIEISRKKIINSIYFLEQDINLYKNKITRDHKINLFNHEQALNIAESIDLKDDILTKSKDGDTKINSIFNEPNSLFYKGEKVINSKIENLKEQLDNLELNSEYNSLISKIESEQIKLNSLEKNNTYIDLLAIEEKIKNNLDLLNIEMFDLEPIVINSSKPTKAISPKKLNYLLLGIFFGLILSFLIIFIRINKNILNK